MDLQLRVALRVVAVVLVVLLASYVLSLLNLTLANRRARKSEAAIQTEVAALETSVPLLETATFRLQTDEGVEQWAREKQKWARPGDQVIVPVEPSATAGVVSTPSPSDSSRLDRLLRWLGGG